MLSCAFVHCLEAINLQQSETARCFITSWCALVDQQAFVHCGAISNCSIYTCCCNVSFPCLCALPMPACCLL